MEKKIGIGVVGAGVIAFHTALSGLNDEETKKKCYLAAVCSHTPGRARAAAERFGVPRAYDTYEELLSDPNVDMVTLCSPIGVHFEQTMKAIKAGVHVHSNKTIAVTYEEADEIDRAAKAKHVKVVSSPNVMVVPMNLRKRKAVLEGKLGKIVYATCSSGDLAHYHLAEKERLGEDMLSTINPAWYFRKPDGGPLYDHIVYGLSVLTGVLGPVRKVTALSGRMRDAFLYRGQTIANEMDDAVFILLEFAVGGFGVAVASPVRDIDKQFGGSTGKFFGLNGYIDLAGLNGDEHQGFRRPYDRLPHTFGRPFGGGPSINDDIMQLVDWILDGGEEPLCSMTHAKHVIDIIDAAVRSAQTGRAVNTRSDFAPLPLERINAMLSGIGEEI